MEISSMELTREQFAKWSFDRDKSVGLYEPHDTFDTLDKDEHDAYLEEADHYLKLPKHDWPDDILKRLT